MTDGTQELEANVMEIIESHFRPTDNSLMPLNATKRIVHLIQQEIAKAREQAIEDVKYAGYGYDDGTGFVLKISYAELATLKEHKEAK